MEEGLILLNPDEKNPAAKQYSPLTLAYVGDAVYELYIRARLAGKGNAPAGKLHMAAKQYVTAKAQSEIAEALIPLLTEEEKDLLRRGRNAKPKSLSKNTDPAEHAKATGLEALFGCLYLKGETERLNELLEKAFELGRS